MLNLSLLRFETPTDSTASTDSTRYWRLIETIIDKQNQDEPLALQVRRERNSFKEEQLGNVKRNFEGVFERLKIFNDVNDVKQFIDKYMAWYYHFDDEQLFEGQEKHDLSEPNNEHEENEEEDEIDSQQSISDAEEEEEEDDDEEVKPKKKQGAKGAKKPSSNGQSAAKDEPAAKEDSKPEQAKQDSAPNADSASVKHE